MQKIVDLLKKCMFGLPVATIIFSTFLPLQARANQALVLFTLIWFYAIIIFDVMGK